MAILILVKNQAFSFFFKDSSQVKFSNRNTHPGEIKTPALNAKIQDISGNYRSLNKQRNYNVFYAWKYKQKCKRLSSVLKAPGSGSNPSFWYYLTFSPMSPKYFLHLPSPGSLFKLLNVLFSLTAACPHLTHPAKHCSKPHPPWSLSQSLYPEFIPHSWSGPRGPGSSLKELYSLPCSIVIWVTAFSTILNHEQLESRCELYHNAWTISTQQALNKHFT